ncbi:DUF2332 domain-containing protein [Ilumatobacter nonamiensis]|uniref:DUF2332 domain-containing protein n=1 Tax=Ilumatobacter nonamiensis TaxID=467093 RepID=UPI0003470A61|nr:DUF2332 domain-containing protein [Ilumatobacter nonamiensis]
MRDPWNDSELVRRFEEHAGASLPRAPLNAALCTTIAADRSLSSLLGHAPVTQQLPVLLLAAIHDQVLREPDRPLADWYPNLTPTPRDPHDPEFVGVLTSFVHERSPSILGTLTTRRVQTNEVGRCALFLPAFALVADDVGPLAHVDVGSSAGLTTLLPHYAYRYDDGPQIGHGPLIECSTQGSGPVPVAIPDVVTARGIDLHPIDPTDPTDARWLQACCWPDQTDRFQRLADALAVARSHPPTVEEGNALDEVGRVVSETAAGAHPVITTSWVLNYFEPEGRRAFVDRLERVAQSTDLSWVIAESPAMTPELPHGDGLVGEERTALTLVTWRDGERDARPLATCHPHGYWLHWHE